jgi:uncharacterized repeat protein (TIGR03843 family)
VSGDLGEVVEIVGRFTVASNATMLGITASGVRVVYKPIAGEQPLWDFAAGSLTDREVLTFLVDRAMGFGLVPETVAGAGPYGPGAVQRFVVADEEFDPLPLARRGDDRLWPVAVLDLVTNNADRKLGHIMATDCGIVAVDHGLTFHPEAKLRTVLWAFAGRELPRQMLDALELLHEALRGDLGADIRGRLGTNEAAAALERVRGLLKKPVHPMPPDDRPAVPWPPY